MSVEGLADSDVNEAVNSVIGGNVFVLVVGDAGSVKDGWGLVVDGSGEVVGLWVVDEDVGSVDGSGGIVDGSVVVVVSPPGLLSPGTQVKSFELST